MSIVNPDYRENVMRRLIQHGVFEWLGPTTSGELCDEIAAILPVAPLPPKHLAVHEAQLAIIEGSVIAMGDTYDISDLIRHFDDIRRANEELAGIDMDAPEATP